MDIGGGRSPDFEALDAAYGCWIVKYGSPQLLPPPRVAFDFAWDAAKAYFTAHVWQEAASRAAQHEDHDNVTHDCGSSLAEEFRTFATANKETP